MIKIKEGCGIEQTKYLGRLKMLSRQDLLQRRNQIDNLRHKTSLSSSQARQLSASIISSWQRSESAHIPLDRDAAPILSPLDSNHPLNHAIDQCQRELKHIAEQSSMVIAVGDIGSTIVWSAASGAMQHAAEKVHFVKGGQWREDIVGTNALALTVKTQQSSCVFSNEHYMHSIQDWVCYAAPIVDPMSKQLVGVIDLSTTWKKHNSLGLLAAERCAAILQNALLDCQKQHLYIRTFTTPQVLYNGKILVLSPRQIEILCILALCPQGMNLESLHHALYGERKVSLGTLKAEISHLRELLGGMIGSRPYRILYEIEADFLQAEQAINAGYIDAALERCTGTFLAKTESPFLCAWRDCLESRLSHAIFETKQTDVLLKHLSRCPEAIDAVERLMELIPESHPTQLRLKQYQQ